MSELRIRNWDKWQSYRSDRGQPPWIKVHRQVMRDPNWVALTDAQRGQLVSIWILAADRDGVIPASPSMVRKLCYMDSDPDLQTLMALGFIEPDADVTPIRRQDDQPEAEAEAEADTSANADEGAPSTEITFGDVMAVVRTVLTLGDKTETDRSANQLKRDFAGRVPPQDVIDACRGARKLIEAGVVDGWEPGKPMGIRHLRGWRHDGRLLWDAALDHERLGAPPPTAKRGKTSPGRLAITLESA